MRLKVNWIEFSLKLMNSRVSWKIPGGVTCVYPRTFFVFASMKIPSLFESPSATPVASETFIQFDSHTRRLCKYLRNLPRRNQLVLISHFTHAGATEEFFKLEFQVFILNFKFSASVAILQFQVVNQLDESGSRWFTHFNQLTRAITIVNR